MSYVPPSQTPPTPPSYSSPTPPPPPPPSYYYPPPPAPRRSFMGGITKLGGVLSFAFLLIAIGFYLALFSMTRGDHLTPREYREGKGMDRIAIIPVTGTIGGGTATYVHAAVEAVLKDESIKAVILRVESPGGGATASDQILHEINRLRGEKRKLPIIASYGDYAASGGYYVSCQADIIFAEPTTVTGSIGVLAEVPTMQVLLEQKLGVKFEELHATGSPEKMTANSMFRDWTEKDRAAMGKLLDAIYGQFASVVAEGRKGKIPADKLPGIANGSIYTAPEAKANGLIDEIGYLDAAIAKAQVLGKFKESEPPVVVFSRPRGLFEALTGSSSSAGQNGSLKLESLLDAGQARAFLDDMSVPRIQMRMSR